VRHGWGKPFPMKSVTQKTTHNYSCTEIRDKSEMRAKTPKNTGGKLAIFPSAGPEVRGIKSPGRHIWGARWIIGCRKGKLGRRKAGKEVKTRAKGRRRSFN